MNWFVLFIVPLLAQAVEATPAPGSTQATLLQLLKSGGWVMIPLILTSVVTLSLIFACLFSLRRATVVTRRFMETAGLTTALMDFCPTSGPWAVIPHSSRWPRCTSC